MTAREGNCLFFFLVALLHFAFFGAEEKKDHPKQFLILIITYPGAWHFYMIWTDCVISRRGFLGVRGRVSNLPLFSSKELHYYFYFFWPSILLSLYHFLPNKPERSRHPICVGLCATILSHHLRS